MQLRHGDILGKGFFHKPSCIQFIARVPNVDCPHGEIRHFFYEKKTTCWFKSPFWANLYLQTSHLNGLFHSWKENNVLIQVIFSSKSVVTNFIFEWLKYFLHEKMQHSDSSHPYEQIFSQKFYIWMAYVIHEQIQNVFSSHPFEQICSYKLHSWMAYFLHEQMQHAFQVSVLRTTIVTSLQMGDYVLHKPRTTDARWSLFSSKSQTFELGQTNWVKKCRSFWVFSAKLQYPFRHCESLVYGFEYLVFFFKNFGFQA